MTRNAIREWLFSNYLSDTDDNRRLVDCIFTQSEWRYIDARREQALSQWSGEGEPPIDEALGFAITALVECHDGPHTAACPAVQAVTA